MNSTKSYYVPTENKNESIEVYVYYSLGGMNWGTSRVERRGMYLLAHPVELADGFKKFAAFSGFKTLLKEMKRKNKKEMLYAEEWIKENHKAIANGFLSDKDSMWGTIKTYGEVDGNKSEG